jgi:hypothetical protein
VEKEFGLNANYAKGHGSMFEKWMHTYHPTAYLFPIARACGGAQQDLGMEGAPAVLMNVPYYIQFLNWRLSIGINSDCILQRKLFTMFRSMEMIALLRLLSILHISICLPTRWLAGNAKDLAEYDFGYYDMGKVLDKMEDCFQEIANDGALILNEDYMMDMFSEVSNAVDPFANYLDFMFTEKLSKRITRVNSEDEKVMPYDELRAELFYPSRVDIRNTDDLVIRLAEEAASTFLIEFRDPLKATSSYLSSVGGKYSISKISDDLRKAGLNKDASNSISESNHASSTHSLKTSGTIRLDSAAGEGQTRANNDFGRGHEALGTGRVGHSGKMERVYGAFHSLPKELQESIIAVAKKFAMSLKKLHDEALAKQKAARLRKEEIAHRKKLIPHEKNILQQWNYMSNIIQSDAGQLGTWQGVYLTS